MIAAVVAHPLGSGDAPHGRSMVSRRLGRTSGGGREPGTVLPWAVRIDGRFGHCENGRRHLVGGGVVNHVPGAVDDVQGAARNGFPKPFSEPKPLERNL